MTMSKNENSDSPPQAIGSHSIHLESINLAKENHTNYDLVDPEIARYAAGRAIEISAKEDKRLKLLVDTRVLAAMVGTYFLQGLDKSTLSFASIMGIREDTHLVGSQYNWSLHAVLVAKYLGANIIVWGTALACAAACQNFAGLATTRVILGMSEACCQPIFVILSSTWYKREEQAATAIYWFVMNGLQQVIGGLIGFAFSTVSSTSPVKGWQALFMTCGLITVIWGFFILFWMPDSPTKAKCFTEEDKKYMIERIRENRTGIQSRVFRKEQVWEAFADPQTYAFALIQLCTAIPSAGLGAFSSLLIQSFGFDVIQTQLLSMISGVVQVAAMLAAVWLDTRYKQVTLTMMAAVLPSIAGSIVFLTVARSDSTRVGLLIAYFCIWTFTAASGLLLSLMSRNIAGQTKKATMIASSFVCWSAGNSVGPQVFRPTDAPRYFIAFSTQSACWIVLITTLFCLRTYYIAQNERKEKLIRDGLAVEDTEFAHSYEDMTDKKNVNFRYFY
ncbi:major facilitator superfamily transporter [Penicillium herquei]|nr:major facilitator superfamily transporter [Penicillium herquei]